MHALITFNVFTNNKRGEINEWKKTSKLSYLERNVQDKIWSVIRRNT